MIQQCSEMLPNKRFDLSYMHAVLTNLIDKDEADR